MRLFAPRIPAVASEVVRTLAEAGDIEVASAAEAELDVTAVLQEYLRLDRELTEKTKDVLERRKLPHEQFGKIKRALAEEKEFGMGEEAFNWISTQLIETFMQSSHVGEVYADDLTMRRRLHAILQHYMAEEETLDTEVRQRIKNLEEGTTVWDVEYKRVMEQIKKKHGLVE